jgi:hypothetical protein
MPCLSVGTLLRNYFTPCLAVTTVFGNYLTPACLWERFEYFVNHFTPSQSVGMLLGLGELFFYCKKIFWFSVTIFVQFNNFFGELFYVLLL